MPGRPAAPFDPRRYSHPPLAFGHVLTIVGVVAFALGFTLGFVAL